MIPLGKRSPRVLRSVALTVAVAMAFASPYVAVAAPPPGAAKPIEKYWDVVRVETGQGVSIGCVVLDGNPLGYYTTYTTYEGWSYVDANGVSYVGWFRDGQAGPYDIVRQSNSFQCGIPGI